MRAKSAPSIIAFGDWVGLYLTGLFLVVFLLVGLGRSLVLGGGETAAEFAALCNGVAAHSPEMDDFHRAATVHPGAVVVPAALAAGQEAGVNGARLLESVVAGYEVAIRVGLMARGSLYGSGFHPTAVLGVFGAAAAAGRAMGLQPSHISQALGLAGTRGAGLLAYKVKGDWSKRLQVGTAASLGVGAARGLARAIWQLDGATALQSVVASLPRSDRW